MRAKKVICTTTNEIFSSVRQAAKKYDLNQSNILQVCKHKNSYCGIVDGKKLCWEFLEDNTYENIVSPNKNVKYPKEYEKKYCIYKIIDSTQQIIYVGKTTSTLRTRLNQHICSNKTYADKQMYHRKDLVILPIIDTNDKKEASNLEEHYINFYKKQYNLLNIKIGDKLTEEMKEHCRQCSTGRVPTESARENMSKAQQGRKHTKATLEKISEANKIKVSVVLLNNLEVFESVSDAAKKYHIRSNRILEQCNLEGHFGELVWVLESDFEKMSTEDVEKRIFFVQNQTTVVCLDNGIIYSSASEASKCLGVDRSTINDCCKGKAKQAKGYKFDYFKNHFDDRHLFKMNNKK